MKILAIETSCDETAISIIEAHGDYPNVTIDIQSNIVLSQASLHAEYGGVFPNLAKREHAKNLVPVLRAALTEAGLPEAPLALPDEFSTFLEETLVREPELIKELEAFFKERGIPQIDGIAVTHGPGLEPALWVGINFAKVLSRAWNLPVIPANHMEGHLLSSFVQKNAFAISQFEFPMLALLISGGHTQLVLVKNWLSYQIVGETRDDAVGEAFDKVARLLGLPYPGGPEISRIAAHGTKNETFTLPRPMIGSDDLDFSFSGIKTAVMYIVKNHPDLTEQDKADLALEFETAVTEVLVKKTTAAAAEHGAKTVILGGGVSANTRIRGAFEDAVYDLDPDAAFLTPDRALTGDNAVMIALAAYFHHTETIDPKDLKAHGTLNLS